MSTTTGLVFRAERRPVLTGLDALAKAVRDEPEGNRNHILYWATMQAVAEGFEPDAIYEALSQAGQDAGLARREVALTIRSGITAAEAKEPDPWADFLPTMLGEWQRAHPDAVSEPRRDELVSWAIAESKRILAEDGLDAEDAAGPPETDAPAGSPFVNIQDYLRDVPTVVPWLAEPLAFFGGVTLLAGIWKGGKSTLVADLMRQCETGGVFFGRRVPVTPTVLVTEEGGIPVRHKFAGLSKLALMDKRMATLSGKVFEDVLNDLVTFCEGQDRQALVVIDTFAVWGDIEDENDSAEITKALHKLAVLAQATGAAIILVDHVRKEGGTHGRGIRGSGAKAATVDIFAVLDYADGGVPTDRSLKLEGRVIDNTALRLTFDVKSRRYDIDDQGDDFTYEEWLKPIPTDGPGLTQKDLQGAWELSERATMRRRDTLINIGRLRRSELVKHAEDAFKSYRYWAIPPAVGPASRPALRVLGADDGQVSDHG